MHSMFDRGGHPMNLSVWIHFVYLAMNFTFGDLSVLSVPGGLLVLHFASYSSRALGGKVTKSTVTLGVLYNSVADVIMTIPLAKSHPSGSEPHASPGLSDCERRNSIHNAQSKH